jgi:hypothetical protein
MKTLEIPVRKIQPEIPFCRCSWIGNDTTRIFPNINNRPDYVVFVNRRWFTAPCRNCVTYFRRVVAFAIRVIAFTSGVIPTFLSIAIRYHIVHRLFKSLTSKVSRKNLPTVDFPLLTDVMALSCRSIPRTNHHENPDIPRGVLCRYESVSQTNTDQYKTILKTLFYHSELPEILF